MRAVVKGAAKSAKYTAVNGADWLDTWRRG